MANRKSAQNTAEAKKPKLFLEPCQYLNTAELSVASEDQTGWFG